VTGPRPSTARRAARSVVVPVTRHGNDRTIGRYAAAVNGGLDPIELYSATHAV
jgi:hypothetical protein